jgi:hypothetical protein
MNNAWETLKKIVIILLVIYFISFIFYTNFLLDVIQMKLNFDFSRYLFKILNLE